MTCVLEKPEVKCEEIARVGRARGTILVVDDDHEMRDLLRDLLSEEGYDVASAESGEEAARLLETWSYDLVITDLKMSGLSGLDLLHRMRETRPQQAVILITAFGSVETVIDAMKAGALDYVIKPFKSEALVIVVGKAFERIRLQEEVVRLRQEVAREYEFANIVGKSRTMQEVFKLVQRVADSRINVLVVGESGTGKELVARAVHYNSPRKSGPFVAINCAAIPETLLESELFGHVRGAFTDAKTEKKGLIEAADGGTLFLDEIGDLPLTLQPKLLRVVQERAVLRLGATRATRVDIRILSATHQDLKEEMRARRFREDLFYRINVLQIDLAPLRKRREDIPLLADFFLKRHTGRPHGDGAERPILGFTDAAMTLLLNYAWPGNVRELENVVERAVTLAREGKIGISELPPALTGQHDAPLLMDQMLARAVSLEALEGEYIQRVLQQVGGNKMRAAQILKIDRKTLYRKLTDLHRAKPIP